MPREEVNSKHYNIVFWSIQYIGIIAFILAWVFDLSYLLIIPLIAVIAILLMLRNYGPPRTPENLPGLMKRFIEFHYFIGRHWIIAIIIITQLSLAFVFFMVIFKANPPKPLSIPALIIAIVITEVAIAACMAVVAIVGKRFRKNWMD